MESSKEKNRFWLICLALFLGSLAVYARVGGFEFVDYDDPAYVIENPRVAGGFTLDNIIWAFTTGYNSNWHPLTWLSHMLDFQLYGLFAGGHHLTNLLLHITNALLLFGILHRMTGAMWRSGLVAALFAWHPLHVESVAWISERKDVLSTFFWLLTMAAYLRYVTKPTPRRYLLTLLFFTLGLMSKPMVVTLPFVLLLLDFWPLQRIADFGLSLNAGKNAKASTQPLLRLIVEKIPFFILTVAASVATFIAQQRGGAMVGSQTLSERAANALISYIRYLRKMIWPTDLAVFYPHLQNWTALEVTGAILLLLGVTIAVIGGRRRQPWLLVGWLWFLGTLVPVIGLVQVGMQSMADRYTYVPLIGIFIMLAWGLNDLTQRWPQYFRMALSAGTALILAACLALTWFQVGHWRNSLTLFNHALKVTPNNFIAHQCLGVALGRLDRYDEAADHFNAALQIEPRTYASLFGLGITRAVQGRTQEAVDNFEATLRVRPDFYLAHLNLAEALATQGKLPEAINHYKECLRLDPNSVEAHSSLALILVRLGALPEAVDQFKGALRLEPGFAELHEQLGEALAKLGNRDAAQASYLEALRLNPDLASAHLQLGLLLGEQGNYADALVHFSNAVKLEPTNQTACINLAGILATNPKAELRNGPEAVQLAERANAQTGNHDPYVLTALDEAYAEVGRFDDAIRTAQQVQQLAASNQQPALVEKAAHRLELYRSGKPFHE
ncbi:MAG: Tetratricopeptide 2 repeat protein [Pedosphaera sp.]|nr:Tetratricopeptide 2 repeat protein [Pedosphaera sp.]